MDSIDYQINDMKLNIICLQSELEKCILEEKKSFNELDLIQFRVRHAEKAYADLYLNKQSNFLIENLTKELIKNVKIIIKNK